MESITPKKGKAHNPESEAPSRGLYKIDSTNSLF